VLGGENEKLAHQSRGLVIPVQESGDAAGEPGHVEGPGTHRVDRRKGGDPFADCRNLPHKPRPRDAESPDGRRIESPTPYFKRFPLAEREGIRAVAMDMWPPYIQSTLANVPGAVDSVRKRENRDLREEGDDTLKRSLHLWLYAKENLPERHRQRFAELKSMNLKTGRAWAIKESLRELWKKWFLSKK
jgi:hypothetical protein